MSNILSIDDNTMNELIECIDTYVVQNYNNLGDCPNLIKLWSDLYKMKALKEGVSEIGNSVQTF